MIEQNLDAWVKVSKEISKDYREHQAIWRYDNAYNFSYGYLVGFIFGSTYATFKGIYKRPPNNDENIEINSIIVARAREIREAVAHLKNKRKITNK